MRTLLISVILLYTLTACGYRSPLALPQPDAKPPASAPSGSAVK